MCRCVKEPHRRFRPRRASLGKKEPGPRAEETGPRHGNRKWVKRICRDDATSRVWWSCQEGVVVLCTSHLTCSW